MKKKLLMLPLLAILASCGGAESDSDGIDQTEDNESISDQLTDLVEEIVEEKDPESVLVVKKDMGKGEDGYSLYDTLVFLKGEETFAYLNPDSLINVTVKIKQDLDYADTSVLCPCLTDLIYTKDDFDTRAYEDCISKKSKKSLSVSGGSSSWFGGRREYSLDVR